MTAPKPRQPGDQAPHFSFHAPEAGRVVASADLKGPCLVYFYPKDDTPGCTKEACGFRDAWDELKRAGLTVVGVSKDSAESHEKFQTKYRLPFPLIADPDLELARAFGVYGEKKFMGKTYDGVHRMSFLIDADGRILKTYPKVKPESHAAQVLEDLAELTPRND